LKQSLKELNSWVQYTKPKISISIDLIVL
jgi:hypothetical protein